GGGSPQHDPGRPERYHSAVPAEVRTWRLQGVHAAGLRRYRCNRWWCHARHPGSRGRAQRSGQVLWLHQPGERGSCHLQGSEGHAGSGQRCSQAWQEYRGDPLTMATTVKVTLVKSVNGRLANHKACVKGLGLRRIGHTVEVQDTPENRGMINKAYYLLRVEG